MKRMKNAARLLTLVLVLCMVLLPLVACKKQNVNGYCTIVLETDPKTVYTVDLDKLGTVDNGLISVFNYLKETEGFDYVEATPGYITKAGALEEDAVAGKYVYFWTSVKEDQSTTPYNPSKEYNGTELIESKVGVSGMTIQNGAIYYIALITF